MRVFCERCMICAKWYFNIAPSWLIKSIKYPTVCSAILIIITSNHWPSFNDSPKGQFGFWLSSFYCRLTLDNYTTYASVDLPFSNSSDVLFLVRQFRALVSQTYFWLCVYLNRTQCFYFWYSEKHIQLTGGKLNVLNHCIVFLQWRFE